MYRALGATALLTFAMAAQMQDVAAQDRPIPYGGPLIDGGQPPRPPVGYDGLRDRMFHLRGGCEAGDRRACVQLGIIIGENREHRAAWRRDYPDVFFYER
jgi:hypothetical protein